jgi:predicted HicB family RNase H-like nuclease
VKDFMEYKGYVGSVRFSAEGQVFHGTGLTQGFHGPLGDYLGLARNAVPQSRS